jgi:hypothetical protein
MHPELFIRDVDFMNYHINHDKWNVIRNWDIQDTVRWVDEFLFYEIDMYTEAVTAQGDGYAIIDYVNGVMSLQATAANDAYDEIAQDAETWQLATGYPLYFEARFKLSDVDDCDWYVGLINSAGIFSAAPQDGVYFRVTDGSASLLFTTEVATVETDVDTGIDLVDATWIRVGFHWDGDGNLRWFVFTDGDAPQACAATGVVTTGFKEDELMNIAFGVRNGSAAKKVGYIDYLKCAMRRNT